MNAASSKLDGIRQGIEDTHHDAAEAAKTLRELESEIMLAQSPGSEFAKASVAADDAKRTVHTTIHNVLNLPVDQDQPGIDSVQAHLKALDESQRETLEGDVRYKNAERILKDANRNLAQVRHAIFEADKDWVAAHQELTDASHQRREDEKDRRRAGAAMAGKKHELQNMSNVAANARSIIAIGEYRLQQLGVSTGNSQGSSTQQLKTR